MLRDEDKAPIRVAWERRNRDLDPQLVWRGKDPDQAEFAVDAPPIYLQVQVHPKALIDEPAGPKLSRPSVEAFFDWPIARAESHQSRS